MNSPRGGAPAAGIGGCLCRSHGGWAPSIHKRVKRLYRLEEMAIWQRKRVARVPRGATPASSWRPGEAWAMDFMHDVLADGRSFRTLNVLDLATRECLAIEAEASLPGQRVVRVCPDERLV